MHAFRKLSVAALAASLFTVGAAAKSTEEPAKKPYPLKICVVSDEALDSEPHIIKHEGRELRLCCSGCEDDFKKDPKKYVAKLDKLTAEKAAEKSPEKPKDGK